MIARNVAGKRRDFCPREPLLREPNMWIYAVGALSAVMLAAIVFMIAVAAKRRARRKKEHGIEMVKISTVFRLENEYNRDYGDPYFSRQLAQAVANEVFLTQSCGLMEDRFAKHNAKAIGKRLHALHRDTELLRVLSLSAHAESSLGKKDAPRAEDSFSPVHRLEELGLLDSSAKVLGANEFERVARNFCDSNGAMRKIEN